MLFAELVLNINNNGHTVPGNQWNLEYQRFGRSLLIILVLITFTQYVLLGYTKRKEKLWLNYPNFPSAIRPEPHSDDIPVSALRNPTVEYSEPELLLQKAANDSDERYVIPTNQSKPFNQQQVSDLIRDLSLCKEHLNSWHIALKTEASYNKVLKWLSQNMRWGICAVYWWKTELIFFS